MKTITSPDNHIIKKLQSLSDKKGRAIYHTFLAEGLRTTSTLLDAGLIPVTILVTDEFLERYSILETDVEPFVVTDALMKKVSGAATPSGIVIEFRIPELPENPTLNSGIVLAEIQDPGNMGTLIRTCAALGLKTVVAVEGVDPWSPKVVQSSAGAIGLVEIISCSWDDFLRLKQDIPAWALVVSGGEPINTLPKPENVLLVVGNEARGLPETWSRTCDKQVTIPMPGNTESLNAAIAGSIALYACHIHQG